MHRVPETMRWSGRALPPLALLAAALFVWEKLTDLLHVPSFLLPGPLEIWRTGIEQRDLLLSNAVPTLQIAVLGFLLAVSLGFVVAVIIRFSRVLQASLYPIVIAS